MIALVFNPNTEMQRHEDFGVQGQPGIHVTEKLPEHILIFHLATHRNSVLACFLQRFFFLRELWAKEVYRNWKHAGQRLRAEAFLVFPCLTAVIYSVATLLPSMGGRAVPAGSLFLLAAKVPFSAET